MPSTQSLIQLGLKLLREGRLEPDDLKDYCETFKIFDVDVSKAIKLAALKSVFSAPGDSSAKYFKPAILDPKHINYPRDNAPAADIPCFEQADGIDSKALIMLEKYGSFVAAVSNDSAVHFQTPVYDLFKTAAAIEDCFKKGEGHEKFLLVGCDFSGIQDTVYTITSKGALKTLRARSFMLELLTEHIIHEILTAVDAGRHAVIFSGGGGFGLLLPNQAKTVNIIGEYAEKLNEWALDEFMARFFIAIDVLTLSTENVKEDFQKQRQLQADNLDKLKRTKFIDQLPKLFKLSMPEQVTVKTECQITRRDDLKDSMMFDLETGTCMNEDSVKNPEDDKWTWVSESCFHQFHLGDRLIDANAVNRYTVIVNRTDKKNYGTLVIPGATGKNVFYKVDKKTDEHAELHWMINGWDGIAVFQYAKYVRKHEELSSYAQMKEIESLNAEGQHVPEPDHTATFQGLASSSCGADLIGALRMDVDNMGDMFSKIETIADLSTKSRMLNLFFKVYLNQICAGNLGVDVLSPTDIVGKNYIAKKPNGENTGRNVSVIYAGGDDLFFIGAWDETTELAFDIQRCFALFTGGILDAAKNAITGGHGISGGLTLHQPKFPLYQMARKSAEAEVFAKHDKDTAFQEKNRIALFFDKEKIHQTKLLPDEIAGRYMLSMTWSLGKDYLVPLMKVYSQCGKTTGKTDEKINFEMNRNTISYQTIEKWFMVLATYRAKGQLYLPVMARVLNEIEKTFSTADRAIFDDLYSYLFTKPYTEGLYLANLHIALNWLSYLRRNY
jgi:CRISPR-associated protein Csm1